jgi:hypothetical protein
MPSLDNTSIVWLSFAVVFAACVYKYYKSSSPVEKNSSRSVARNTGENKSSDEEGSTTDGKTAENGPDGQTISEGDSQDSREKILQQV